MFASTFTPDESKSAEFLACLWQGPVPETLELSKWIYLLGRAASDADPLGRRRGRPCQYIEHAFGGFGTIHTEPVTDATPGLAAAFARDLDAFGRHMEETGSSPDGHRQRGSMFAAAVWKPRARKTRPPPAVRGPPSRSRH